MPPVGEAVGRGLWNAVEKPLFWPIETWMKAFGADGHSLKWYSMYSGRLLILQFLK